jgi:hypothetical protein
MKELKQSQLKMKLVTPMKVMKKKIFFEKTVIFFTGCTGFI